MEVREVFRFLSRLCFKLAAKRFFRVLADCHLIEREEYIYEKQGRYLG